MKTPKTSKAVALHSIIIALTLGLTVGVQPAQASEQDLFKAIENWQKNRLFEPTPEQRTYERDGDVVIYDGLIDTMVEKAIDQNFDRIQNMMFTRIVVTDKNGHPKRYDDGQVVTADDGC